MFQVFNRKFVEIGRVAYIVSGPYAGRLCAIVDIIDQNKVSKHFLVLNIMKIFLTLEMYLLVK